MSKVSEHTPENAVAEVRYAGDLNQKHKDTLLSKVQATYPEVNEIEYTQDPSLIAGFIFEYQGLQYDASLKGKVQLVRRHVTTQQEA